MSTLYQNGQEHNVVSSTKHYGVFKLDPRNRPISMDHVQELYDSISRKNLLDLYPIVVNEDMLIIDGQHRFVAARELGVPIYYIVSSKALITDIAEVAKNNMKWTSHDRLHYYCSHNIEDYLILRKFLATYQFIRIGTAVNLCYFGDWRQVKCDFDAGKYRCNDIDFGIKVAEHVKAFGAWIKHYKDNAFIHAIRNLMANDQYRPEVMIEKMEYLSPKLVRCPDMDTYISVINEIYNYKARSNKIELVHLNSNNPHYRTDRKQS